MTLEIQSIHKSFSGQPTLSDINLQIAPGEFVCLLGPSGCGKTTLLRIVAGLLSPDAGALRLNGQSLQTQSARERRFGIVFQSYSLFPHMTVADNVAYGLRLLKANKHDIHARVTQLLNMVRLTDLQDRYPQQLSGGQQQRVALARALAIEPRVLLLDEPLSALDAQVRAQLRMEIRDIQQRLNIPTLMVTHDQDEAMEMADRIVCMQQGRIAQVGTAQQLYQHPQNRFVAEFMGSSNMLQSHTVIQLWPHLAQPSDTGQERQKVLCVRPEHLHIHPHQRPIKNAAAAQVQQVLFSGPWQKVQLQCHHQLLWAQASAQMALHTGQNVHVELASEHATWVAA
ncbi:ABC transporter ATP-binding protein [Lampropedia puyangensis]|uniref:ABC transporter ATP-binding protein n=1 Tax=Lampropedia puyangensis TaxID=1330072 RepID=A0A4S8F2X4_9BURK|nr:ABC transporter ATP-binding protein [Lampropedia puyangensis]THU01081.1 ABC transporter ATP-binding protein [Lampropedia puyangensis]